VQAGITPNLAPEAGAKGEASRAIEVEILLMSHARLVRDQNKVVQNRTHPRDVKMLGIYRKINLACSSDLN
jgi:hypothetical protein